MTLIYLASPYTHADPAVMQSRFEAACRAAAVLMRAGRAVFSPIAHSVPIARHGRLPATDLAFWMAVDRPLLEACDEMVVLRLPGWEQSLGVAEELRMAKARGMLVIFMDPDEYVPAGDAS